MTQITVKATISSGHKVTVTVPLDWPEGSEVEAVLRSVETESQRIERNKSLIAFLESLQKQPGRASRTKEEIDRYIEEERNSWE